MRRWPLAVTVERHENCVDGISSQAVDACKHRTGANHEGVGNQIDTNFVLERRYGYLCHVRRTFGGGHGREAAAWQAFILDLAGYTSDE